MLVVLPDETSPLAIEEGKDYCTLVTCTPYGVNTHRLLVRGHRVAEASAADILPRDSFTDWIAANPMMAVLAVMLVLLMITFAVTRKQVTIQSPLKVTIILLFFRDFMQNIDL